MTARPPGFRTLSDADVDAISARLRLLLSRPCVAPIDVKRRRIEVVPRRPCEVTPEQLQARAALANVTPENAALQDVPPPMLRALLVHWEREQGGAQA